MINVVLYLKSGKSIIASCTEDDFGELYGIWEKCFDGMASHGIMAFENCVVRAEDVSVIEYV